MEQDPDYWNQLCLGRPGAEHPDWTGSAPSVTWQRPLSGTSFGIPGKISGVMYQAAGPRSLSEGKGDGLDLSSVLEVQRGPAPLAVTLSLPLALVDAMRGDLRGGAWCVVPGTLHEWLPLH
jgi:hypothetical protein